MLLDVRTIVYMSTAICLLVAVLLLVSWLQNREARSLGWWSVAYLAAAIGSVLLVLRGMIPDFLSIDLANATVLVGFGLIWVGVRSFDSKPIRLEVSLIGALVWLIACRIPEFYTFFPARAAMSSTLIGAYSGAIAWELWQRRAQAPASRSTLAVIFAAHALGHAGRAALAVGQGDMGEFMQPGPWFALTALFPMLLAVSTAVLLLSMTRERAEAAHRLAAAVDPLTGLANRRAIFAEGDRLVQGASHAGKPVSVLIFDLDRFKQINDRYGHPIGDRVLCAFADVLKTSLRKGDLCGRLGGEEFIAVLPGVDAAGAGFIAERIRHALVLAIGSGSLKGIPVTVSTGVAALCGEAADFDALVAGADHALYAAKTGGRDRVHTAFAKAKAG